ncbi:hypothetical protein A2U01_0086664, partial [Trifolium medium]|nr:hypothetical protein [Trifolium medium]
MLARGEERSIAREHAKWSSGFPRFVVFLPASLLMRRLPLRWVRLLRKRVIIWPGVS